jgi:hypothetical protein
MVGTIASCLFLDSCSTSPLNRSISSEDPVSSLDELRHRIANAEKGETILISRGVEIDLTGEPPILIDHPVKIAAASLPLIAQKPHLFDKKNPLPMFKITSDEVTLEGLWLEGFEKDSKKEEIIALNKKGIKGVYQFPVTRGIEVSAKKTVIRDCVLEGFSHAAIFVMEGGEVIVERNEIHHNQRWGLGYGVALHQKSSAEIFMNRFDFNRHSIAGSGFSGQSYEAHQNWFGQNHNDTPLDMHGGKDRGDGTDVAGTSVYIHDNEILDSGCPIFIHRGIAEKGVIISNNIIYSKTPERVIGYYNGVTKALLPEAKFKFENNTFK